MRNCKISVAMASFNGEKYIKEQIRTILDNFEENDELVISDDGSTDKTKEIIESFQDHRIKIIEGPHKGIKANFNNAINNTSGDIIFLSDQDDIWMKDKVMKVIKYFDDDTILVQHDAIVIDEKENVIIESFANYRNVKKGIIKNLIKNSYHGCCIAFKKELKDYILPIPDNIYLHDQWIGMIAECEGETRFVSDKLIKYRRHSGNNSTFKHLPLDKMITNRFQYAKQLLVYRLKKRRRNETR